MMCVTTILLNILIAQLSLTYEMVQEESLHSFTALRMKAVATIEWQSRFTFWVSIYSLRHRKCGVRGFIHELFVSKTRTSEVRASEGF